MRRPSLRELRRLRAAARDHHPWADPAVERVYLHHVRKTGGTSVNDAFLSLGGESGVAVERRMGGGPPRWTTTDGVTVVAHDRLAICSGWYSYAWSHIPAWRLRHRPGGVSPRHRIPPRSARRTRPPARPVRG